MCLLYLRVLVQTGAFCLPCYIYYVSYIDRISRQAGIQPYVRLYFEIEGIRGGKGQGVVTGFGSLRKLSMALTATYTIGYITTKRTKTTGDIRYLKLIIDRWAAKTADNAERQWSVDVVM